MSEHHTDSGAESSRDAVPTESMGERAPAPRRKRHWGLILIGVFVVLPIAALILWTAIALNWSYSEGRRVGFVQKFSEKGWVCKTWEGELAMTPVPGAVPEKFQFSVRDDSVAHQIQRLMGSRVAITYEEHRGIPSRCFGDTQYYVTAVRPTT